MNIVHPHVLWRDSDPDAIREIASLKLTSEDVIIIRAPNDQTGQALAYDIASMLQRQVILLVDETELLAINWKDLAELAS